MSKGHFRVTCKIMRLMTWKDQCIIIVLRDKHLAVVMISRRRILYKAYLHRIYQNLISGRLKLLKDLKI
jgi:hypothetical protein